MDVKTQTEDLSQRLNEAVLQAAMSSNDVHFPTLADAHEEAQKNLEKTRVGDGSAGPGRPRNVKNRLTNLREAVLEAFDQVGGAAYLAKLAQGTSSDRAAFVGLVSKVLPTQINANVEGGIQVQLSWLSGRSIGTTASQIAEPVTQVIDLERDNGGKYRIVDPIAQSDAGADGGGQAGKAAGDAQGA
jgi:hypothetical protein